METVLEFVIPGTEEPILIFNNPPAVPSLGDLTIGPDGTVFQIMQRAYIIEQKTPPKIQLVGAKQAEGRLVWQCVIVPIELTPPGGEEDAE